MRWIVDAAMILRSGDPINRQRLPEFTDRHLLSRRVARGPGYLKERFDMACRIRSSDGWEDIAA